MTDFLQAHYLALGEQYARMMAHADIERCNCMVRWNDGSQMPAVKTGKKFYTPAGDEIVEPTSHEMLHHSAIAKIMKDRGEVYIGHLFPAVTP